jgi:hypothetical protein
MCRVWTRFSEHLQEYFILSYFGMENRFVEDSNFKNVRVMNILY